MKIILASASPRRKELIGAMGIRDFIVRPSPFDEGAVTEPDVKKRVALLAEGKANAVEADGDDIVIAADTLVFIDGETLGKPRDRADADRMLHLLSGREHTVATGVAVRRGGYFESGVETTLVRFRELTDGEIARYIDSGEPMDKAGAYGIQTLGAMLVEGITGDYFNVVGLPVCRLGQMLKRAGLELL